MAKLAPMNADHADMHEFENISNIRGGPDQSQFLESQEMDKLLPNNNVTDS